MCAARPGASLGVRDFVVRSSLREPPRAASHATAPHPCGDGSRCGPAVQSYGFLRCGNAPAGQFFRTRRHGRRGPGKRKTGRSPEVVSVFLPVSCGSAALPGPLACSARCGGLPFVRRTLRSRSGFPVLCATLEACAGFPVACAAGVSRPVCGCAAGVPQRLSPPVIAAPAGAGDQSSSSPS